MNSQASSTSKIDNSINLPDYFSCSDCPAGKYHHGGKCDEFQRAGRCRAVMLAKALEAGRVQIHLHIPVGRLPG
jgi:hypothetical protein